LNCGNDCCIVSTQLAAERRRQQETADANFLAVEGVARPNPPQMEISVPQMVSRRHPSSPARGHRLGGAGVIHRRPAPSNRRPQQQTAPNSQSASTNGSANRTRRRVRYNIARIINERANEGHDIEVCCEFYFY